MTLSNVLNNERFYLLGYTIQYIENYMMKNKRLNLETPISFVFLFAGEANSEIAIIEELLRLYPQINIKSIFFISNYDIYINSPNKVKDNFIELLPKTEVYTFTFKDFNKKLNENAIVFRHNERVLCFAINSQVMEKNDNSDIGKFYRIWLSKYKRPVKILGSSKYRYPIKIDPNFINNFTNFSNSKLSEYIFSLGSSKNLIEMNKRKIINKIKR